MVGCSSNAMAKQLEALQELRIVKRTRRHFFSMDEGVVGNPKPGVIDCGRVVLYFDRETIDRREADPEKIKDASL